MFDADQARRQAKDLLRAARQRDPAALTRLPHGDKPLRLADAQLVIARESGARSWPALLRRDERFRPVRHADVVWQQVRKLTLVPFTYDGDVVLVADGNRFVLPTGAVRPGEDPLVHAALRITLETAAFRRQQTHVLAASADGRHVVVWIDGARYAGERPHRRDAAWCTGPAAAGSALLSERGDDALALLIDAAEEARVALTDDEYAQDCIRLTDAVYLAETTPQGGSGFHGSAEAWRATHEGICDAIDRDGTFLDVGCANGHLVECLEAWSAERGHRIEGHGVDISGALIDLAIRRLPRPADTFWVGDAQTWIPPGGRRFDFVHTLLDLARPTQQTELIRHVLDRVVAPGGRLIVSQYMHSEPDRWAEPTLTGLGFNIAGVSSRATPFGRHQIAPCAWIDKP